jgi:hypothetical protein
MLLTQKRGPSPKATAPIYFEKVAERVGFEPTVGVNPLRFSSPLNPLCPNAKTQELLGNQTTRSRQSIAHPSNSCHVTTPTLRQV